MKNTDGTTAEHEVFISVDVETSGPVPGEFSLLSIGACLVDDDSRTFSCLLKPITDKADPSALRVTGLTLERLREDGLEPAEAMGQFEAWVGDVTGDGTAVFVGFNAGFDWSFVNYYFHRYAGKNPFGFAPLDIKSLYMGATGCSWRETRSSKVTESLRPERHGNHNAVDDALAQAELFRLTLKQIQNRGGIGNL